MTPTAKGTRTTTSSALAWVTLMAPWRGPGRTCGLWATRSAAGRCHDRSDGPRPENGRQVPPLRVLLAFPHRGALLGECPRAFPRVLRGEHRAHHPGHLVPALGRGPVAAAVRNRLAGHQRQRPVDRDLLRQRDRGLQRLTLVHDAVDQAD